MVNEQSQTKQLIRQEFLQLYGKRDYSRITNKDLCLAIPIARTTIYSYYQNIYQLKLEIEQQLVTGIISRVEQQGIPVEDSFDDFFHCTMVYLD